MANPYHDFTADRPVHPYEELNKSMGGLGDAIAAHFAQQEQNKDELKKLMWKAQLDRENSIALEKNKQGTEFDYEGKRIDRGRQMFPGMFPSNETAPQSDNLPDNAPVNQPDDNLPATANLPVGGQSPLVGAMPLTMGGQANFNPVQAAAPAQPQPRPMSQPIPNPVSQSSPKGWDVNPNFAVTGKGDMFAKRPDNSLQLQEKQSQFNQREWDKLTKEVNPLTTSGRNPLGMAMKANYNANRALSTLSNPMVTNQEAGNVMADIASIYQNGSPTQFGMSEQGYHTLTAKIAGFKQFLSGKPQDALTPDIKARLLDVLYDMKRTNYDVLRQNLDYTEKAKAKLIQAFPDEWKDMRETLLSDAYSGLNDKGTNAKSKKLSGEKDYSALWQ